MQFNYYNFGINTDLHVINDDYDDEINNYACKSENLWYKTNGLYHRIQKHEFPTTDFTEMMDELMLDFWND